MWLRELVLILLYVGFYPVSIIWACLSLNAGILSWFLIAVLLCPEVILTYRYYRKLALRRLTQMLEAESVDPDIDGYVQSVKDAERRKGDNI